MQLWHGKYSKTVRFNMSIPEQLTACVLAVLLGISVPLSASDGVDQGQADVINLGGDLTESQLQALPRHVFADGQGLPAGSGDVQQGALLYATHCASCHGSAGQGGKALELIGERVSLATDYPDRGIAVFWPHAPTLYEYINRSMPPETPGMFKADELYALIAHLLHINGLLDSMEVLDAEKLSNIQMPNKDGFDTVGR